MTGDLFDPADNAALTRHDNPRTSVDAAASLTPDKLTDLQQIVLCALKAAPDGLTTFEIGEAAGIERDTISPRIKPLVTAGLVQNSGRTRIPPGRTRKAIVWRIRE
jgi:DNA-binding MarR family transcriptional regulator